MSRTRVLIAAAVLAAVAAAVGGGIVLSSGAQAAPAAQDTPANTASVQKGKLSAMVSHDGTLTYRARPDGSPYAVVNQAGGVYTELPQNGDKVDCGGVLYRVNEKPVVLLCGLVPAYRALRRGDVGQDVLQLNRSLHELGYDSGAPVRSGSGESTFTVETEKALKVLQHDKGVRATGALPLGDAVFLSEPVRIADVSGDLGGYAQPGAPVLGATSDKLHVQVDLDPSQQSEVKAGDRAQITLPGNTPVSGSVEGFGTVAHVPAGQDGTASAATIPTYISLDDPAQAQALDSAPVQVQITTDGVEGALSVPVTALVGNSGGGFAVEAARDGGQRRLVAVQLGLFDAAGGRVQVEGDLREGDQVVVPSP